MIKQKRRCEFSDVEMGLTTDLTPLGGGMYFDREGYEVDIYGQPVYRNTETNKLVGFSGTAGNPRVWS